MRPCCVTSVNGCAYVALVLLLLPATAWSQQEKASGTVTGRVFCADVNLPARLVQMWLLPLTKPKVSGTGQKSDGRKQVSAQSKIDGSFVFSRVVPGEYYIQADYPGYLNPESRFPHEELRKPTDKEYVEMIKTLPTVSGVANKTVYVEVPLERGGSITGTVRYDHGALAHVEMELMRRDGAGRWSRTFTRATTDDLGRFRLAGVSQGEYTLAASLSAQDSSGSWSRSELKIYFGDVFLERDAKSFKVGEGEESAENDLVIRLSKLHSVNGALLDVGGRLINAGEVTLSTVPDDIEVVKAQVEAEDSAFHMEFVPEGHYMLRVTDARNVTRETLLPPEGFVPIPVQKETLLQSFGSYEIPFEVLSDLPNVNLTMPNKSK